MTHLLFTADMSGLILGPPGSKVTLGFLADTVPSRFYEVRKMLALACMCVAAGLC